MGFPEKQSIKLVTYYKTYIPWSVLGNSLTSLTPESNLFIFKSYHGFRQWQHKRWPHRPWILTDKNRIIHDAPHAFFGVSDTYCR